MESTPRDFKAGGACKLTGGIYKDVSLAGVAKVDGDLTCDSLSVAGSGSLDGNVTTGDCRLSGSAHVHGDLSASILHISGSGRIDGNVKASNELRISGSGKIGGDVASEGEVRISGSTHIGGMLKAVDLRLSGSAHIGHGVECESMTTSGGFTIGGLINAGTLDITLIGNCKADEIGGETVTVRSTAERSFNLFGLNLKLSAGYNTLTANLIEASDIRLERTKATTVRGQSVVVGPGCDIELVEYSDSLTIDESSTVGRQVKSA